MAKRTGKIASPNSKKETPNEKPLVPKAHLMHQKKRLLKDEKDRKADGLIAGNAQHRELPEVDSCLLERASYALLDGFDGINDCLLGVGCVKSENEYQKF